MSATALPERRAERLRATVLFVDVLGFSALCDRAGTTAAYLSVTRCLKGLDGIARSHGGSVDKYLGDRLMAVFGHPVPSEDPSSAACRAALEMRAWFDRMRAEAPAGAPDDLHIGVNTGDIVAGDLRGGVVREFHVLGDAVNVAARLNAKAGAGEIFVGPGTFADTSDSFAYRELEPLALKGKSAPVPAYALLAERAERQLEDDLGVIDGPPWLGEGGALASLRAHRSALAGGQGGLVLLTGPEGIGKTRLLQELAADPNSGSIRLEQAVCPAGADAAKVALELEALGSAAAQGEPCLVLFDDTHWLAGPALDAVAALAARTRTEPLLLVMASRDEPPQALARLRTLLDDAPAVRTEELRVPTLTPELAERLLEQLPGAGRLPPEDRDLVLARSGGNPGRLGLAVHLAPALRVQQENAARIDARTRESERRRTAVLFADITGFTAMTEQLGAERAYPIVAECLHRLDVVARKHGGTVDHYLGDCVLALFGVPEALEDAPRSAINAAIEMREAVRRQNDEHGLESKLDLHSGIATGAGIAGDISGALIREFAVMGDHVDRAYALADLAPAGEIFTDDGTRKHTAASFDFEARPPAELGSGRRGQPFRLTSDRVRLHRERIGTERQIFSSLVGRAEELEEIRKRIAGLVAGEGGVVSILAEAGVGKSRLVAEIETSADAEGLLWLEGRSISNGRNLSFHPFSDLCRGWADIGDEDDEDSAAVKIERAVRGLLDDDEAREILPFLKTLLGTALGQDERDTLESLQGDVRERLLRRSMARLVTRMAEARPVVLVMDDLHWADLSSVELLEALLPLAEEQRLLFLLVSRPGFRDTAGRILDAVRGAPALRHLGLELHPLDARASRALVRNVFGSGDVPHDTRRMIEDKAKGNPFFIEEVVRALLDAGAVEWRNGALHATPALAGFEIPGTVQDVVMARVDRLDLERRRVLQLASVIGGTFHASVLEALCSDELDVAHALEELLAAEFIVPDDRSRGVEYSFKHPLIQEVTYGGLLENQRQDLHLQVGEAIEEQMPEGAPGLEASLAYHFTMARAADRAEAHLFQAGEEAARSAASSEALHFFREASRLYLETHGDEADPAKKAILARNIARALFHRGQLIEAEHEFNNALGLLGQPVPRSLPALGARLATRLAPMATRLYLGERLGRRRPATEREVEIVALMLERGMCEITVDPTRFVLDSLDTLATALRVDPATIPTATRVLAGASTIFSYGGLSFGLSRKLLDMARQRVSDADLQGLIMFKVANFIHHTYEGDWSDAHDIDEALLERAIDQGLIWDALTYLGFHAERFIGRGDFARARERIDTVAQVWDRFGHDLGRSTTHALQTYLALEEGRFEDAVVAADVYYDENPEPLLHLLALGGKGRALARLGRLDEAEQTLDRCDPIIAELGRAQVPPYQLSHVLRGRLVLEVARLEEAAAAGDAAARRRWRRRAGRTLRAALGAVRSCALRRVEVLRLRGTLAWLDGAEARAVACWEASLAEAERLGTRPEAARGHAEIAEHLESRTGLTVAGLGAQEHRSLGMSEFEALGLAAPAPSRAR